MAFKTYSWMYGTTSFRVSELKYKIERQLIRLKNLYDNNQENYDWRSLQAEYLESLLDEDWFNSNAKSDAEIKKYAREVTSSLSDLGLLTQDREVTDVGNKLFEILRNNDFNFDNPFGIRNDSFLYLKQFLKVEFSDNVSSNYYSEFSINPFIALVYFIAKHGHITKDEFQYLLPIVKNYDGLQNLDINMKNRTIDVQNIIYTKIQNMENYQDALTKFKASNEGVATFKKMLIARKPTKKPEKYMNLYLAIKGEYIEEIITAITMLPTKTRAKYYQILFNSSNKPTQSNISVAKEYFLTLDFNKNLKENFFYLVHFARWKTNLEEYSDNNKRFLGLSDIFIFGDKIKLTPIAEVYFKTIENDLLKIPLSNSADGYQKLSTTNKTINEINSLLHISDSVLLQNLKNKYPQLSTNNIRKSIEGINKQKHKDKLDALIDNHFSNLQLKNLLGYIKNRNDSKVKRYLHWDCDTPTVFEYIIGIVFYVMNGRTGYIQDFLNMSIDADLLPRRFAGGGKADLVFNYGSHSALIEVTLSKKENQRKMELEPVSRHLGRHKLNNDNPNDYVIFIASHLDPNVLVNFRSYKDLRYYNTSDTSRYVDSLKIIPFNIDDICLIIDRGYNRVKLEDKIENSYVDDEKDGLIWYENILKPSL